PLLLRNPDATIVTERFGHKGQFRLIRAADRDAGRVDLRKAGVCEVCTPLVAPPRSGNVRVLGVRREVEDVAVPSGTEKDGIGDVPLELAGHEVPGDDPPRL